MGSRVLERRTIYGGRVVELAIERVQLPNGTVVDLELVHHAGAAAVVPVSPAGEVVLVRQYRHATGGWLLEVPAGKVEGGELPAACAARETEEETGYRPRHLEPLGWIWSSPGFADERIWLYLATGLEAVGQELEPDEVLDIERLAFGEALSRAVDGRITDAKTVCALLRAARRHPALSAPR